MRSSRSTCRGRPRRGARSAGSGASGERVRPAPSVRVAPRGRRVAPRDHGEASRGLLAVVVATRTFTTLCSLPTLRSLPTLAVSWPFLSPDPRSVPTLAVSRPSPSPDPHRLPTLAGFLHHIFVELRWPPPARYALHDYCTIAHAQLLDCDALDVLSELQARADTSVSEAATHIFQKVVPLIWSI